MRKNEDITFNTKGNTIKVTMIVEDYDIDIDKIFMGIDYDCPQFKEVIHEVEVSDEDVKLFKSFGNDIDKKISKFITFIYGYQLNNIKRDLRKAEGNYKRAVTYIANHSDIKPETKEKYVTRIVEKKQIAIELEQELKDLKIIISTLYRKLSTMAYFEIQESKLIERIDDKLKELEIHFYELQRLQEKKQSLLSE